MNSTNRLIVGAAILSLIATAGITAVSQAAPNEENQSLRTERFEQSRQAIENNDYQAWVESLGDHPKADEFVTEETFEILQEAHRLAEAGDKEGARALLQDAGIKRPGKHRRGGGEQPEAVREALQNNDYQAWAELLANHPNADAFVNESTFAVLREAYLLKEAGDREGARALLQEAGIKHPRRAQR